MHLHFRVEFAYRMYEAVVSDLAQMPSRAATSSELDTKRYIDTHNSNRVY
jgi:hypothetical protein